MRVSDSKKVVFVHVPKSGGSTIDLIFDREVEDARKIADRARHAPYGRLLNAEPDLADYWSFGFVRNPWARLVSWWAMVHGLFERAEQGHQAAIDKIEGAPGVWKPEGQYANDFDGFILEGTTTLAKLGRPQLVTLSAKDRMVDFVGRVENYDHDVAIVRERLGLPPVEKLPRQNKSSHGHYSEYYNPETRAKVAEVYAADIEAFGYEYEDRT